VETFILIVKIFYPAGNHGFVTFPLYKQIIMRLLFITVLFSCLNFVSTHAQSPNVFYNKKFKWTITLPEGLDTVNAVEWKKMQSKGEELIEETLGQEMIVTVKTLLVMRYDRFNYFECNYQPYDSTEFDSYATSFNEVNEILYNTFKAQIPEAKMDSSTGSAMIDGLEFLQYKVVIRLGDQLELNWYMFSRLFGTDEFTVNIMTADRTKEKELIEAFFRSTFRK
jgi:hypothetical protein